VERLILGKEFSSGSLNLGWRYNADLLVCVLFWPRDLEDTPFGGHAIGGGCLIRERLAF